MSRSAGVEEAARLFARAGLVRPPVPSSLAARFVEHHEWSFATRDLSCSLYAWYPFLEEAVLGGVEDYIATGHAGHGMNSYAIHYYLLYGPLALFVQVPWGGVSSDAERDAAAVRDRLELCGRLITACERAGSSSQGRLVVAQTGFGRGGICRWLDAPVPDQEFARGWLQGAHDPRLADPLRRAFLEFASQDAESDPDA